MSLETKPPNYPVPLESLKVAKKKHAIIKKKRQVPRWSGSIDVTNDAELEEVVKDADINSNRIM
jgi:hypothetical protein